MNDKRSTPASQIAFGGMLAALAIVLMSLGGLVPVLTYVTPMVCACILQIVHQTCGNRVAWAWYGAVSILGMIICPDKESAAVFLFIGYYPIVKPGLDRTKLPWLWKLLYFNCSILILYFLLLRLIGIEELTNEFAEMGTIMTVVMLILGNVTFFLMDRLLRVRFQRRRQR